MGGPALGQRQSRRAGRGCGRGARYGEGAGAAAGDEGCLGRERAEEREEEAGDVDAEGLDEQLAEAAGAGVAGVDSFWPEVTDTSFLHYSHIYKLWYELAPTRKDFVKPRQCIYAFALRFFRTSSARASPRLSQTLSPQPSRNSAVASCYPPVRRELCLSAAAAALRE